VVGEEAQPPSQEGDRLAAVFAPALEHLGVGEPGGFCPMFCVGSG
jgi:hypothetical protein